MRMQNLLELHAYMLTMPMEFIDLSVIGNPNDLTHLLSLDSSFINSIVFLLPSLHAYVVACVLN